MADQAFMHLMQYVRNNKIENCFKTSLKLGAIAGGATTAGFLFGGPVGAAIAGMFGVAYGAASAKNSPSLISVLQNLDEYEREELLEDLMNLSSVESLAMLSRLLSNGSPSIKEFVIEVLKRYFQ